MKMNDKGPFFDEETRHNINMWLEGSYDEETKAEVRRMVEECPQDAIDAFYTSLTFGTAGLRGIMGPGTNRVNGYVIRQATQGLANFINRQSGGEKSVFISYDSRHHSRFFAEETAKVFAANGIKVYIVKELRPVPMVSFGTRYKKCSAGVMITASHNLPQYNGYKVFGADGVQIRSPQDVQIIEEVRKITDLQSVKSVEIDNSLIRWVGDEIDEAYLCAIDPLMTFPEETRRDGAALKIVYTPLHGAGVTMVPRALKRWGFTQLLLVKEQAQPDGAFPTVNKPNPGEWAAMQMGIEYLTRENADLLIGTDPDDDRMGVGVIEKGIPYLFTGNQIACIALYYICSSLKKKEALPQKAAFVKSIVTTELFKAIADSFDTLCVDVLTGFKYIGAQIEEWEADPDGYHYLYGGEESYGTLRGIHARDKDAIVAPCLLAEAALYAKKEGKTLLGLLYEIYEKCGVYRESVASLTFEGKAGKEKMAGMMAAMREDPPKAFMDISVVCLEDFLSSQRILFKEGKEEPLPFPTSDVLLFWLEDGTKIVVRPSGTEPVIKLYCGVVEKRFDDVQQAIDACDIKLEALLSALQNSLT
ncbi:phospho-sugar mutase [Simkania negevensis]|uniref:Phospho-sugar mutase n=1 Tax=Simkania negevensis TaxID=83561 RepID=A0ABS3ARN1_9BACT|nr:phospho-sugar mutase [Simkania negevensis]